MKLEVPMVPPSGDELRRKYRTVFAYRDLRMAWEKALLICCGSAITRKYLQCQALEAHCAYEKLKVAVTIYRAKILDDDNCVAGLKPCLDSLEENGFIYSDEPKDIELPRPQQIIEPKRRLRRTVIEITPT